MRKLFKNSFFSFFSNKFIIIALSVIIFISTAAFTMLQTTANAFQNSWDQTELKGKLHDFTIKQKYEIKGSLQFDFSTSNSQQKSIDVNLAFDGNESKGDFQEYISNPPKSAPFDPTKQITIPLTNPGEIAAAKKAAIAPKSKSRQEFMAIASVSAKVNSVTNQITNFLTTRKNDKFINDVNNKVNANEEKIYGRQVSSTSVYFNNNGTQDAFKAVDTLRAKDADGNPIDNDVDKTIVYEGNNVEAHISVDKLKSELIAIVNPPGGRSDEWFKKFGIHPSLKGKITTSDINVTKDYAVSATVSTIGPTGSYIPLKTFSISDFTSYEAVISPTYAKKHEVEPINLENFREGFEKYKKDKDASGSDGVLRSVSDFVTYLKNNAEKTPTPNTNEGYFKNLYDKSKSSIVWVDSTPEIVTGIGITPDFSFPIIDQSNPVPNGESQAVVFVNHFGYRRIQDAFRTNPTENYLAYKFKDGISKEQQGNILKKVEAIAKKDMSWPSNVQIVSKYNDTNGETVLMAPQRVAFLESLQKTINTISYVTIIALSFLTGFITIIIIKRQIASKRRTLAILVAEGYSKTKVSLSMMTIGFIVGAIPSVVGYLTGLFLQPLFINVFTNYWTIPVSTIPFSYISLLVTMIIPIIAIGALSFVIALWEQRGTTINALHAVDMSSSSLATRMIMPLFTKLGIKNRISLSLFSTNISRMLMVTLASGTSIGAAAIAITSLSKFNNAQSQTSKTTNYSFKVDLNTPTLEGGQYELSISDNPYKVDQSLQKLWQDNQAPRTWLGMSNYTKKDGTNPFIDNPTKTQDVENELAAVNQNIAKSSALQFPNVHDGALAFDWKNNLSANKKLAAAHGLEYLKNKTQTKALLNGQFGLGPLASRPWDIAKALMPDNQLNAANQSEIDFFDKMKSDPEIRKKYEGLPWWNNGNPPATSPTKGGIGLILDPQFVNFMNEGIYKKRINPYFLSYNQVVANKNDEVYTYISGELDAKNIKGKNTSDEIKVTGVNENSRFVNLSKDNYKALNDKSNKENGVIPVVVNLYFEKYYKKGLGDTFSLKVNNMADRYQHHLTPVPKKFKIVGTIPSFAGSKVYTLRSLANNALGLYNNSQTINEKTPGFDAKQGFNGIFTAQKDPTVLKNINLYSPSGVYPPFDTIIPGDDNSGALFDKFFNPSNFENQKPEDNILNIKEDGDASALHPGTPVFTNYEFKQRMTQIYNNAKSGGGTSGEIAKRAVQDFIATYGKSTFVSLTDNVQWSYMNNLTFENLSNLSSQLIIIIETIALAISLLFIFVTASLLYDSNKKTIAALKVNGYTDGEIKSILLKTFLPAVILGGLLSIPFVFIILKAMIVAIMSFGKIYIPLVMIGWEIPAATTGIVGAFILMYLLSVNSMKSKEMLSSFSSDE